MEHALLYPVLYSFRRCPYAIRARMVIAYAEISIELREVLLRNKPETMLQISPKGTVPVLQLKDNTVIDESLEIMLWTLTQHDPENWLDSLSNEACNFLVEYNDGEFKYYLDRYKYSDRYTEHPQVYYREKAAVFLTELENRLRMTNFLYGKRFSLPDAAIVPFIRQFVHVDPHWFASSPYKSVANWLNHTLQSPLFLSVMKKYKPWVPGDAMLYISNQPEWESQQPS